MKDDREPDSTGLTATAPAMSRISASVTFLLYSEGLLASLPPVADLTVIRTVNTSSSLPSRSSTRRAVAILIDSAKINTAMPNPTVASIADDLTGDRRRLVSADRSVRILGSSAIPGSGTCYS